ncbi:MAG: hypothetical protein QOD67_3338, partial [Caballeronia sp.]|nr:hypothetical protein [Caballeronia sp.]
SVDELHSQIRKHRRLYSSGFIKVFVPARLSFFKRRLCLPIQMYTL